jgi:hypothetical protein
MPVPSSKLMDPYSVVTQLFAALDRKNENAMVALLAADVVLVDEVSCRWLRGLVDVQAQIHAILDDTSFIESRLSDLQSRPIGGDAVLVTGWLDQRYCIGGQEKTITAPLSACLEWAEGTWKVISLHAIPLPAAVD